MTRSANNSILGYLYQFIWCIKEILLLENDTDTIEAEGIEDIDIHTQSSVSAIQCKYYAGTEYNHSEISEPIRFMLEDFARRRQASAPAVNYKLVGNYKSGQHKLNQPITTTTLKSDFLTYKRKGVEIRQHESLSLSDHDLDDFLQLLHVDINAPIFDKLYKEVIDLIITSMRCDRIDAELYYFAGALAIVSELSAKSAGRTVSKKDFLKSIDNKRILFTKWQNAYQNESEWIKRIRSSIYPSINSSSRNRYVIIDFLIDESNLGEVGMLIDSANKKMSSNSARDPSPYCPIFCFPNINEDNLKKLKRTLYNSSWKIIDGYPYRNSDYIKEELDTIPPRGRPSLLKILSSYSEIEEIIQNRTRVSQTLVFASEIRQSTLDWKTSTDLYAFGVSSITRIKEILR
jgi:hypothetical protein